MGYGHTYMLRRAKGVQNLVKQHYEKGNHAKCYRQVWRLYSYPVYPMSYNTFLKYVKMDLTDFEGSVKAL